ncbi:MAG: class I SAM-dependent methyltransferase [Kiritimatiellia bacterium]
MKKNEDSLHYGDIFVEDPYVRRRFAIYRDMISGILSERSVVLDVGGYMGDMLRLLENCGQKPASYYVADSDVEALKIAEQRGAIPVFFDFNKGDMLSVLPDVKFDVILCTEVLEHLLDPERHLKAIAKLLSSEGVCVVSLPNENSIYHRMMSLAGFGVDQCAFEVHKHLHLPTISQSRRLVGSHLHIIDERYYINPSLRGSRGGAMGRLLTLFPDAFWDFLAGTMPGLFARGVVFKTQTAPQPPRI